MAIAVHPDDKRYKEYIGKDVELPLCNRKIPIIADDYVDMDFGSGAVKITPGHDFNDYEIGKKNDLEIISVIDNNGLINGATYNSSADGGFSFDGNDDKVVIQHDNSLNFESNLTVIYTLKPNWLNSVYSPGISKGENKNSNFSTWIGRDNQIDISTQVGNNQTENVNSLRPAYDATNDISAGNWYTIAITIDSSNNQKTYINGSQVGVTKSITLGATNTLNLTIGQLPGFGHSTYGAVSYTHLTLPTKA